MILRRGCAQVSANHVTVHCSGAASGALWEVLHVAVLVEDLSLCEFTTDATPLNQSI